MPAPSSEGERLCLKTAVNEWKILVRTGIWEEGAREERNPAAGRIWEGFMQEGGCGVGRRPGRNCQ